MPMQGGILGDDLFGDEEVAPKKSKTPILDATEDEIESANKKLSSGQMLFPEDEKELKSKTKRRSHYRDEDDDEAIEKDPRPSTSKYIVPVEIYDELNEALDRFEAETANKRSIRRVRKALQALSLARYPKKKKSKEQREKSKKRFAKLVIKKKSKK